MTPAVNGGMAAGPKEVSDTEDFFEMSIDHLCVAGLDGYFLRVNPSWTRTLGWTAAELLSRPSVEFVHPDDRDATLGGRKKLQMGSAMGPLTNRYACKDGSYRWFEWHSIAHLDRGLVFAAARDVTEQRQAQKQLVLVDRMASLGTLASGVGHEINNPLAGVAANISLIIEELASVPRKHSDGELHHMAMDAQAAAERIRKIVLGLMSFSRAEKERRGIVDLRPVLERAIDLASHEIRGRARLVKELGDTPLVDADEARVGQVFINLLVNAARAIPEGRSDANEVRVVTATDGAGRAVIEIRDTGLGIPPAELARIFDPFFTMKAVGVGTGLGLSICHTIVTAMGGNISASSEPGKGAIFRVVLPAASPEGRALAPSADAPPAPAPAPAQPAAVLVVDDEPGVGTALGRVLRQHDVTVVLTAKKALELLAEGKRFDVIFSDLMMPEMSGMDFYDELTQRFPDAARRVVFMSGGAFTPRAEAFFDRVSNARIDKPFDPSAVRTLVAAASTARSERPTSS